MSGSMISFLKPEAHVSAQVLLMPRTSLAYANCKDVKTILREDLYMVRLLWSWFVLSNTTSHCGCVTAKLGQMGFHHLSLQAKWMICLPNCLTFLGEVWARRVLFVVDSTWNFARDDVLSLDVAAKKMTFSLWWKKPQRKMIRIWLLMFVLWLLHLKVYPRFTKTIVLTMDVQR